MFDADERRAGAVILKDLALFNKAAILFEEKIEPEIRIAISKCVADWIAQRQWKGEHDVSSSLADMWVCSDEWQVSGDPFAKFYFAQQTEGESISYESADLFDVGQTLWGFRFEVVHSWYGGKPRWNAIFRKGGMADLTDEIVANGWIHQGKGAFFKPLKLPAASLASAWEADDWTEVLNPLEKALDGLWDEADLFARFIRAANPGVHEKR